MSSPPRLRAVGLVVGLAVLALASGFFLLTRGQGSSSAASTHTVVPLSKRANGSKKKPAVHKRTTKPVQKRKTAPKPAPPPPAVNGVPGSVAAAFAQHRVVVVSLFAPRVDLDDMATREARVGAAAAGAGFVPLNVLDESQARPLTQKLGVLEDPMVLVYRRPGDLVVQFSGYADQQTIAQAARNAAL